MARAEHLELADWRRQIAELYAEVRKHPDREAACALWRSARNELFARHSQSPLPTDARKNFTGLAYYPYDPRFCVVGKLTPTDEEILQLPSSANGSHSFKRFARAEFSLLDRHFGLDLFWLEEYAGGIFLSFQDATTGETTYGAGRYLLDTAKGADLGTTDEGIVVDFNFSYNPSCAYSPRWACPLPPESNRLSLPIEAGERIA